MKGGDPHRQAEYLYMMCCLSLSVLVIYQQQESPNNRVIPPYISQITIRYFDWIVHLPSFSMVRNLSLIPMSNG
jgi:hypothetical protein